VNIVDRGLKTKENEKVRFIKLTRRLVKSKDRAEQERLKKVLARLTLGGRA
jgi:hypothetical protein